MENKIFFVRMMMCLAVNLLSGCSKEDNLTTTPGARDPRSPAISPIADQVINLPQNKITLDGSPNISLNSTIELNYFQWNLIQKPVANPGLVISRGKSAITEVTGFTVGSYLFTLDITNSLGLTSTDTIGVNVLPDSLKGVTRVYEGLTWKPGNDIWEGEYSYLGIAEKGTFAFRSDATLAIKVLDENNQPWFEEGSFYVSVNAEGLSISKYDDANRLLPGRKAKLQVTFQ